MSVPENHPLRSKTNPIAAEEFDRRAEDGENLDEYFDWDNAVTVEPGEMSPGQVDSLLAVLSKLSFSDKSMLVGRMLDDLAAWATRGPENDDPRSHVFLPVLLHTRLRLVAKTRQVTDEALLQSWIEEKLEGQEVVK